MKKRKRYKQWRIIRLPSNVVNEFKKACRNNKIEYLEATKKLMREYVNEIDEVGKYAVDYSEYSNRRGTTILAFSNFPTNLLTDFKSRCSLNGDLSTNVIIGKLIKWTEEN